MNTIIKGLLALSIAATLGVAATPAAFAKGHNQGFGNQSAGPATAGLVDNGQKNLTGGREGSYGIRDQVPEVRDNQEAGIHGNSDNAQTKDEFHPSSR